MPSDGVPEAGGATSSSTVNVCGPLIAPGALIVTVSRYVPALSPLTSAFATLTAGAFRPLAGSSFSQFCVFVAVQLSAPGLAFEITKGALTGLAPPSMAVKTNDGTFTRGATASAELPLPVTVTVVVAIAEPPRPSAVNLYVVVVVGLTEIEVPLTAPISGISVRLISPLTFQDSVLDPPATMDDGLAVKLLITGKAGFVTVTVAFAVADPALFVAVSV